MVLKKLPGWVVDNKTSVRDECADYVNMTPRQRAEQLKFACQVAAMQLKDRANRELLLNWVDRLPESTVRALERLRAEAKARKAS